MEQVQLVHGDIQRHNGNRIELQRQISPTSNRTAKTLTITPVRDVIICDWRNGIRCYWRRFSS